VETNVPVRVFGVGTVEAQILSKLGFESAGTLVELHADHGDLVEKGALLGRLQDDEHRAKLQKADAAVRQADVNVEKARTQVARARIVLTQKVQANERRQALVARGSVSREAAEETQTAEDTARSDLQVAEGEVRVVEAALSDAQAQRRYEEVMLEQHVLRAPYRARVIARHKELGSVVNPGEPVFTLIDPDTVWVKAFVDESRAGGLSPGMPAEIRLRSLPAQSRSGEIVRIDLESDRVTEERRVYVRCSDNHETLYLGEQAEVVLTKSTIRRGLFVPVAMVEAYDGRTGMIWIVENGILQRRRVELGEKLLDGRIEVRTSLPDHVSLVVAGASLQAGRKALVRS
jgi:HlyD family secretion protein